jgi:Pyridoxal-phosphate dependent enzyme
VDTLTFLSTQGALQDIWLVAIAVAVVVDTGMAHKSLLLVLVVLFELLSTNSMSAALNHAHAYSLPTWCRNAFAKPPSHGRLHLANLPTPLYQLILRSDSSMSKILQDNNISLYIKRDDMTGGIELGGNKIRKLEFLLCEALASGCDSVVTIGGEQSNHCRATASAARMLGLEPHLILRTRREGDIGLVGKLVTSTLVRQASMGEWGQQSC